MKRIIIYIPFIIVYAILFTLNSCTKFNESSRQSRIKALAEDSETHLVWVTAPQNSSSFANYVLISPSSGRQKKIGYEIKCNDIPSLNKLLIGLGFNDSESEPGEVYNRDELAEFVDYQNSPKLYCQKSAPPKYYTLYLNDSGAALYYLQTSFAPNILLEVGCHGIFAGLGLNLDDATVLNVADIIGVKIKDLNCRRGKSPEVGTTGLSFVNQCEANVDPNSSFEILKQKFGESSCEELWNSDLDGTLELDLSAESLTEIKALRYIPSLQNLYLANNRLKDISDLGSLKRLRNIDLRQNPELDNPDVLAKLPWLEEVNLLGTNVKGLDGLRKLTKLRRIEADWLDIEPQFCPFDAKAKALRKACARTGKMPFLNFCLYATTKENKHVVDVIMDRLNITSCEDAATFLYRLPSLNLTNEGIRSLEPLMNLSNLQNLDLSHNTIDDLSGIETLVSLERLNVDDNNILDLYPLALLAPEKLLELSVRGNRILDLNPLKDFTGLNVFNIDEKYIDRDTCPIEEALSGLVRTACRNAMIKKAPFVVDCEVDLENNTGNNFWNALKERPSETCREMWTRIKNLTSLTLETKGVQYIKPLKHLVSLRQIYLKNNLIRNIEPLEDLHNLRVLDISYNREVKDIAPIMHHRSLSRLLIEKTAIVSLKPLKNLLKIESIDTFEKINEADCPTDASSTYLAKACLLHIAPTFEKSCKKFTLTDADLNKQAFYQAMKLKYSDDGQNCADLWNLVKDKVSINLANEFLSDISGLHFLSLIEELDLSYNSFADIDVVTSMPFLNSLNLKSTPVTDLKALKTLLGISNLNIRSTQVQNLNPLKEHSGIKTFKISWNMIVRTKTACPINAKSIPIRTGCRNYLSGYGYIGDWKDNRHHGKGMLRKKDGSIFMGTWTDGSLSGEVEILYPTKGAYRGAVVGEKKSGIGKMIYINGETYEGQWVDDFMHGSGVYKWPRGHQIKFRSFDGDFDRGVMKKGTLTYWNGDIYIGSILGDKPHTEDNDQAEIQYNSGKRRGDSFKGSFKNGEIQKGIYYYRNGDVYEGEFVKGKRHGTGKLTIAARRMIKDGSWKHDRLNGIAKITQYAKSKNAFVMQYEGGFKDDEYHGIGKKCYHNDCDNYFYQGNWSMGEKHHYRLGTYAIYKSKWYDYEGEYKNGKRHGKGNATYKNSWLKSYTKHGNNTHGEWHNDKWHGKGYLKYKSGESYSGGFYLGERKGYGVYRWPKGDWEKYEGNYKRNQENGQGKIYFRSSGWKTFEGTMKNGNPSYGTAIYRSSIKTLEKYHGRITTHNGKLKRHGWGRVDYRKNSHDYGYYVGNFYHGYYHGKGKVVYQRGSLSYYDGYWNYDDWHATSRWKTSVLKHKDGEVHIGLWKSRRLYNGYLVRGYRGVEGSGVTKRRYSRYSSSKFRLDNWHRWWTYWKYWKTPF